MPNHPPLPPGVLFSICNPQPDCIAQIGVGYGQKMLRVDSPLDMELLRAFMAERWRAHVETHYSIQCELCSNGRANADAWRKWRAEA